MCRGSSAWVISAFAEGSEVDIWIEEERLVRCQRRWTVYNAESRGPVGRLYRSRHGASTRRRARHLCCLQLASSIGRDRQRRKTLNPDKRKKRMLVLAKHSAVDPVFAAQKSFAPALGTRRALDTTKNSRCRILDGGLSVKGSG